MRFLILFSFAAVMLFAACDKPSPANTSAPTPTATSSNALATKYVCESGEAVTAFYPSTEKAVVRYKGSEHDMKIDVSGSGARYVGGEFEWWTKGSGPGSEGTLFRHNPDGTSGDIVERCKAA